MENLLWRFCVSEIRSERNINLNIQNIVVATYIEGRPVRLGHISVKLKRDMLVKLYLFTGGACGDISVTTINNKKSFLGGSYKTWRSFS